ncbi:MAG TPA: ABC transporter substrate-binding protein [Dehalococcoidia bacterium]|nr:ABC transporter substrate-binding protein [Dehalococcoidia bacterium]
MLIPNRRLAAFVVGAVALAGLALAACGGEEEEAPGGTPTAPATAPAGETPAGGIDISGIPELEDRTLDVGSDIAYAPIEFYEGDTPKGLDIDLATALADVLGVDVEFHNTGFDAIIPSLLGNRFDVIMSAMTVTDERKQQIDFVEYANVGVGIVVAKGNPEGIETVEDLCGRTVAVQEGTIQVDILVAQDQACRNAGQQGIEILRFGTDPEAVDQVKAGRAVAVLNDFPVAFVAAQENPDTLEVLDTQIDPAPYGIGLRKESTALKAALEQALEQLKADGTYRRIFETWNMESAMLD